MSSVPSRPERLTFFIDRSLGTGVGIALREHGYRVQLHEGRFRRRESNDTEWLAAAGMNRWVVLTKDQNLRYNKLEKEALIQSGVRAFVVTAGGLTRQALTSLLLMHMPRIVELSESELPPFVAHVTRTKVSIMDL
ncbi:MAG: hypothetical protein M5U26_06140 [Planctomycetota bacterium]|nr:hypothetical protein [Planctomycetota bacterium]